MASSTPKTSLTITPAFRSKVKDKISELINTYFVNTLAREADVVNVVNAIAWHESRYNPEALGPIVSSSPGTYGYKYLTSSVCQIIKNNSSTAPEDLQKKTNIDLGLRAYGLIQVMGWNIIRAGTQTGICEMDRLRPDLSAQLVINAGESISDKMLGENNVHNQILAGLILLEGGYKICRQNKDGFYIPGDRYKRVFSTKLSGAVATYIGLGKSDGNITPETFIARIMGGAAYEAANGNNTSTYRVATNVKSPNGPSNASTGLKPITIAGCG
jgi:hypothetical protein